MQDLESHKIVFLGQAGVGKSSIVLRFSKDHYSPYIDSTIGASFFTKTVNINNKHVKLDIWDTAGQERYHSLAPMYYRGAHAVIITYDVTDMESFERAKEWLNEVDSYCTLKNPESQPLIYFVGNKFDLVKGEPTCRQITSDQVSQYCRSNNAYHVEVSAKSGHNVMELFHELGHRLNTKSKRGDYDPDKTKALYLQLNDLDMKEENQTSIGYRCCWY